MKKSTLAIIVVLVIVILSIVLIGRSGNKADVTTSIPADISSSATKTPVIPSSQTVKVSSKLLSYTNEELGFSVQYPNSWEKTETNNGVTFIIPIDKSQISTVAKLQADVIAAPGDGTCSFPPITTVKERDTLKVGNFTFNMISMNNTVQGMGYFDRMYSLQQDGSCYFFRLSTITLSPQSKNLTGSNLTVAQNNNKAIVSSTDTAFINMTKSFSLVSTPAGQDETKVAPTKK